MSYVIVALLLILIGINLYYILHVRKQYGAVKGDTALYPREQQCASDWLVTIIDKEISAPLSIIAGYLQIAGHEKNMPFAVSRNIQMAQETTIQIEHFISEITAYRRYNSDEFEPQNEPVNLSALILTIAADQRKRAQKRGLQLSTTIDSSMHHSFSTDYSLMEQIITSLLSNSVNYTLRGTITLEAKRVDEQVVISIEDTGVGISSDLVKRFFESENIRPHLSNGHGGLGILLVRKAVDALGGTISCNSDINMGTTITLSLPLKQIESVFHEKENALITKEYKIMKSGEVEPLAEMVTMPNKYLDDLVKKEDIATLLDNLHVAALIGDPQECEEIIARLVPMIQENDNLKMIHMMIHQFEFGEAKNAVESLATKQGVVLLGGRYV